MQTADKNKHQTHWMNKNIDKTTMLGVSEKEMKQQEMSYDKNLYKRQLVEVLRQYDEFCRKHNLKYSIAYGTMLGAIRHKGLIPWDDDIDVMMPREDYDRFIQMTLDGMTEDCDVVSPYNRKNYYIRYAKVIYKHSTIIELAMFRKCPIGTFIDVFPMDNFGPTYLKTQISDRLLRRHTYQARLLSAIPFSENFGFLHSCLCLLMKLCGMTAQKEWLKAEKRCRKFACRKSSRMIFYGGLDNYANAISSSLFEHLIDVPFEDIIVRCFEKYDAYLTNTYGDYMQLPPETQRISHHYHYFIDLNNGQSH